MKALIVAHESEFIGGANRALFALLRYWKDNDLLEYEVLLPSEKGECIQELKSLGIKYHVTKYYKVFSELQHQPSDLLRKVKVRAKEMYNKKSAKKFSKTIEDAGFRLVYSNTRMTSMGACIAKELGIPHVIHIREFGNNNTFWGGVTINWIYENSAHIITISKTLNSYLIKGLSEDKFSVSYDGVSYKHSVDFDKPENKKKGKVDILLTGRITPAKAQDEAIRAVKELKNRGYEEFKLHFAGSISKDSKYEKEYLEYLQQLIKEYDLSSEVVFHGEVSNMQSLREKMDIELMCAIRETFGWVTVEGMRSGLLVIGGNTGATPEIIKDNKTGLLYRQGDANDLADKILWAINHPVDVLKIRKSAYSYSNHHFTVEENANDVLTVFKRVLECDF